MVETASPPFAIFDGRRRALARRRCLGRFAEHDFLFRWTENVLLERLEDIRRQFSVSALLGSRSSPGFHQALKARAGAEILACMDTIPGQGAMLLGDAEFLPFGNGRLDAVFSILELHAVGDLPGALLQIRKCLKPDGLFLAAMFGGETLHQLRDSLMQAEIELKGGVSPRIFPFADKPQMGALLQRAGFALPVVDSEILTVSYENIFSLMHDLRLMGESNAVTARSRINPGREFFLRAAEHYAKNFSEPDGRIKAGFEIVFMIGWAPHDSQQKPLKPGSAVKRLGEALQTPEVKIADD